MIGKYETKICVEFEMFYILFFICSTFRMHVQRCCNSIWYFMLFSEFRVWFLVLGCIGNGFFPKFKPDNVFQNKALLLEQQICIFHTTWIYCFVECLSHYVIFVTNLTRCFVEPYRGFANVAYCAYKCIVCHKEGTMVDLATEVDEAWVVELPSKKIHKPSSFI